MGNCFDNLVKLVPHIDIAFRDFYNHLLESTLLKDYFENEEQVDNLIQKQKLFFKKSLEMNNKELDIAFVKLGEFHQKLKIPYIDFMKGMDILEESFLIYSQKEIKSIELIEEIFKYFRLIKIKTAHGYLNVMLDEDERDIETFFLALSHDEYTETREVVFDRISLLKLLIRLIKYNEKFDIDNEEEEFQKWINNIDFIEAKKKIFIQDLEKRIVSSIRKLLYLYEQGEYLEILHVYSSLLNIYKLSLLISNSVSITMADYIRDNLKMDKLTNLYRKDSFFQFLQKEIENSKRNKGIFSLVFIDIDNFKVINDEYGHLNGDAVLSKVGEIINMNIRASYIGFRYGGDELAIIIKDANKNNTFTVCEKIKNEINLNKFNVDDDNFFYIDVSMGIYEYDGSELLDAEELLSKADELLYKSKKDGKGKINY